MSASHTSPSDLSSLASESGLIRSVFAGQCRLLAERAERNLAIDDRSVENLLRIYENLVVKELIS